MGLQFEWYVLFRAQASIFLFYFYTYKTCKLNRHRFNFGLQFLARYYHWPVETLNKLHNFYNGQLCTMERVPAHEIDSKRTGNGNAIEINQNPQENEPSQCKQRFLLTTLLASDPPGPPEENFHWKAIEARRKTTSPLIGL